MPWVIGIDEAGYGPNLGPLVQAAVALKLPEDDTAGWRTFKSAIRQAKDDEDQRTLVDDSKKGYCLENGLALLERGIQPFPKALTAILNGFGLAGGLAELEREYWFAGEEADESNTDGCVPFGPRRVNTVATARFNR